MPGSVALQKKHVEGSGAVRKENAGLGYTAKGRRRLLGCTESHLCTMQGLPPPQSTAGVGALFPGNAGSGAAATGLPAVSQAEKPGQVLGEKQQPLPHFWPSHALEAFPSALARTRVSESGAAGAEPAAGGKSRQLLPSAGFFPS